LDTLTAYTDKFLTFCKENTLV